MTLAVAKLTVAELKDIDTEITRVEANTGAQIVVANLAKSDNYPALPWIAFAILASLAALVVVILGSLPTWDAVTNPWPIAAGVIGTGAAGALMTVFIPRFARIFLHAEHAQVEVRQQAHVLFLEHELFATRERCGVLLLMSVFERQVVVLPDKGLRARVPETAWASVVDAMRTPLADGRHRQAISIGLMALEKVLQDRGVRANGRVTNELPNNVIATKGT